MSNSSIKNVFKWPKLGLKSKFPDLGTFGGFGKREHTNTQTRFMFYEYRYRYVMGFF